MRDKRGGERRAAAKALGALALGALAVAAAPRTPQAQDRPAVLATVGMIADVAANVAGDCAEVGALMGPGVDPHLYRASAGDVRRLQDADAILYAGHSLEGQLGEVLKRLGERKPTLAVAEAAVPRGELIAAGGAYAVDPHVWMDASLWARTAEPIARILGELAPGCAEAMNERARSYRGQLEALHGWIEASVATVPEGQRVLVTAHDAFAYFGRAYGIEVVGVQGVSTEAEAGVADIRAVVDAVVERGVPAVFVESTVNPRTVRAVIDAAADRGHEVEVGGELYSDAMGEPGTAGGTYVGMLFENTAAIALALGGGIAPLPPELRPWAERWGVESADLAEAAE